MKKILDSIGRSLLVVALIALFAAPAASQIKHAKIEFERRTNLYKLFKDNEFVRGPMMDYVKNNKIKKETFYLYVDDSSSVFAPKPVQEEGWAAWLTQKNTTFQNFNQDERLQVMELWGNKVYVKDTLKKREWKITYDKRMIAGYECRKAIWQADDSTRIYAWYSDQLELSTGPETFNGLPGAILGLATEDGGIVYFAKSVEVKYVNVPEQQPAYKEKDLRTEAELIEEIKTRFSKSGNADQIVKGLFAF